MDFEYVLSACNRNIPYYHEWHFQLQSKMFHDAWLLVFGVVLAIAIQLHLPLLIFELVVPAMPPIGLRSGISLDCGVARIVLYFDMSS